MLYHFIIHKDSDGLWAECVELEGCHTQSKDGTLEDLKKNMEEALNLYLDEPNYNRVFPLPDESIKEPNVIEVPVEPGIAFAILLRKKRKERNLTQKEMAKQLGFSNLWSYQKLESPINNNPQLNTLEKIKKVIPDIDFNLLFHT